MGIDIMAAEFYTATTFFSNELLSMIGGYFFVGLFIVAAFRRFYTEKRRISFENAVVHASSCNHCVHRVQIPFICCCDADTVAVNDK